MKLFFKLFALFSTLVAVNGGECFKILFFLRPNYGSNYNVFYLVNKRKVNN